MEKSFRIFSTNIDEIHTFEAYRGGIFKKDNDILIPFINIGVSKHPLNNSKTLQFIDYSYLLFEEVISLEWSIGYIDEELFYIGAQNIISDEQREIAIKCKRVSLVLKAESKLSPNMWIPVDTPNFRPNLDKKYVDSFMNDNFDLVLQAICQNCDLAD